jgi:hypothetical protein
VFCNVAEVDGVEVEDDEMRLFSTANTVREGPRDRTGDAAPSPPDCSVPTCPPPCMVGGSVDNKQLEVSPGWCHLSAISCIPQNIVLPEIFPLKSRNCLIFFKLIL